MNDKSAKFTKMRTFMFHEQGSLASAGGPFLRLGALVEVLLWTPDVKGSGFGVGVPSVVHQP